MRTNRVVVLFSDEEFEELVKRAGEVPLSAWIRKRAIDLKVDASRLRGKAMMREMVESAKLPDAFAPTDLSLSICEHGATAYNCKKWGCKFYEIPNGRK